MIHIERERKRVNIQKRKKALCTQYVFIIEMRINETI